MVIKTISKKEVIEKTKWLRKTINKWGERFKREKNYIIVDSKEKRRFMEILRGLESYLALEKKH